LNDLSAVPEYVLSFSAARVVALHLQQQIIRPVAEATLRKVKLSPVRTARRVGVLRFDSCDIAAMPKMIRRRAFFAGGAALAIAPAYLGLAHTGLWTRLKAEFSNAKCGSDCFSQDWKQLDYEEYYNSLFELGPSRQLKVVATGPSIRAELREAFGGANLHAPRPETLRVLSTERIQDFTVHKIQFVLDCGVPVVGCAALPRNTPRGLALLAHGIGTTPDRCFNMTSPDYMAAIGARLCAAGFAVWCPFMPQAGNEPGLDNLAGMLSLDGVSYHNIVCSALNSGPWVVRQMNVREVPVVRYAMSWGTVVAATLEAATTAGQPSVLSGYLRDEERLVNSGWFKDRSSEPFLTYLHQLPNSVNYFFPALARLLRPCPLYFEVGNSDEINGNAFGRDDAFAKIQSIYREVDAENAVALRLFAGGHEVEGSESIKWLLMQG
jgi:hypothetical protein